MFKIGDRVQMPLGLTGTVVGFAVCVEPEPSMWHKQNDPFQTVIVRIENTAAHVRADFYCCVSVVPEQLLPIL